MPTLSSLLVQRGAASMRAVEEAISRQVLHGGDLATNVMELSAIPEATLTQLLAESMGVEPAIGRLRPATPEVLRAIPRELALRHGVFPIELRDAAAGFPVDTLVIATSEPLASVVEDDLSFALGVSLIQLAAPFVRIRQAQAEYYDIPLDRRLLRLAERLDVESAPSASLPPVAEPATASQPSVHADHEDPGFSSAGPSSAVPEPGSDATEDPAERADVLAEDTVVPLEEGQPEIDPAGAAPLESTHATLAPSATLTSGLTTSTSVIPPTLSGVRPKRVTGPRALKGWLKQALIEQGQQGTLPQSEVSAGAQIREVPAGERDLELPAHVRGRSSEPGSLARWPAATAAADVERAPRTQSRPRRKGPFTMAMAEQELAQAASIEAVLDVVFDFAQQYFHYAALFLVQGDIAEGQRAAGPGAGREPITALRVPLDRPGMLATARDRRAPFVAAPAGAGADADLLRDLGRARLGAVAVLPVAVRNRVVAIVYGDDGEAPVELPAIGEVIALASLASPALERLILRKKRSRSTSLAAPDSSGDPSALQRASALSEHALKALSARPGAQPAGPAEPWSSAEPEAEADAFGGGFAGSTRSASATANDDRDTLEALGPPSAPRIDGLRLHPIGTRGADQGPLTARTRAALLELSQPRSGASSQGDARAGASPDEEPVTASPHDLMVLAREGAGRRPAWSGPEEEPQDDSPTAVMALGQLEHIDALARTMSLPRTGVEAEADADPIAGHAHAAAGASTAVTVPRGYDPEVHVRRTVPASHAPVPTPANAPTELMSAPKVPEIPLPLEAEWTRDAAFSTEAEGDPAHRGALHLHGDEIEAAPRLSASAHDRSSAWGVSSSAFPPTARAAGIPGERAPRPPGDLQDDAALVQQLLEGGEDSMKAFADLVQRGEAAMKAIVARFPGPLRVDRRIREHLAALDAHASVRPAPDWAPPVKPPPPPLPAASECGPLLELIVAIRRPALPFMTVKSASSDAEVRFWATHVLGELRYPEAANALLPRLFDDDIAVRRVARRSAAALMSSDAGPPGKQGPAGRHADAPAGGPILQGLENIACDLDESVPRRLHAIEIMADIRVGAMVPPLIAVLSDPHELLVDAAARALITIAREDFGRDARAWSAWWERNAGRHRIEWLIDALMHEQPLLRRAAGDELKAITREFFGYYDDLPRRERERAQARYRAWWSTEGRARFLRPAR